MPTTSYHDALLDAQARKLLRLSPAMRTKLIDRFFEGDDDRKQKMLDRLDQLESGDDPKAYRNPGELLAELEQLEGEEPGAVPAQTTGTAAKPAAGTVRKARDSQRAILRKALGDEPVKYERKVNEDSDSDVADEPPAFTVKGKGKRRKGTGNTLDGALSRAQTDRRSLLAKLEDEVEKRGTSEGARKGWLTRKGGGGGRGRSNASRQVPRASALDSATGRTPKLDRRKASSLSAADIGRQSAAAATRLKAQRSAKVKAGRKAGKAARARLGRTSQAYKNALSRQAAKRGYKGHSKDKDADRVIDDFRGTSRRGKVRKPATRRSLLGG